MKFNLTQRLIISFAFLILICVMIIGVLSNFLLDNQFKKYVMDKQSAQNTEITSQVSKQYDADKNSWNVNTIENIGINALSEGIIVKVKDINGNVVWDATVHNNGLCNQMLEHMAQNMLSRYPNFKGAYVENENDILYNGQVIGKIELGYYGPFYFSDNDLEFINELNKIFIVSGVVSLIFAIFLGMFVSKNIVKPVFKVIDKAQLISKGYYSDRIEDSSNIVEISELVNSINNLAKKLEEQENLRKKLVGDMSHELRTPLASIQGHLEAMIDGVWEPTEERLTSCHEEILRINRMVEDIDRLARLEDENSNLKITETDISKIMKNILNNFQKQIVDKNVSVEFKYTPTKINVDKDKIAQVFVNILSNSIKYTNKNGHIIIDIFEDNNDVVIDIKDDGIGISKEDLPYIFERLYRADKSRSRDTGGSGIGLTIAKRIIDLHKGNIEIVSEKNVGTDVKIILNKIQ